MLFLAVLGLLLQLEFRLVRGQKGVEILLDERGQISEEVLFGATGASGCKGPFVILLV